eukprot:1883749-Pyramimonas_sp.AAC.1
MGQARVDQARLSHELSKTELAATQLMGGRHARVDGRVCAARGLAAELSCTGMGHTKPNKKMLYQVGSGRINALQFRARLVQARLG